MDQKPQGPSYTLMLTLLGMAIVIALIIAHRLIAPFLHR